MNKLLVTASLLAFTAFTSQAQADSAQRWPNWYVGVSEGVTFLQPADLHTGAAHNRESFNPGSNTTLALGYMPPATMWPFSNLRMEAEAGYHYDTAKNFDGRSAGGTLHTWSYMGNLYYDFRNNSAWTPYVGAGAGDANVQISKGLILTNNSDNVFAYQFMAGVSYAPTTIPNTEWNLGYRYFDAVDPEFSSIGGTTTKSSDMRSNEAELGAKFRF